VASLYIQNIEEKGKEKRISNIHVSKYRQGIQNNSGNQNVLNHTMVCATVLGFNRKRFSAR
jgi:hypothetical protein